MSPTLKFISKVLTLSSLLLNDSSDSSGRRSYPLPSPSFSPFVNNVLRQCYEAQVHGGLHGGLHQDPRAVILGNVDLATEEFVESQNDDSESSSSSSSSSSSMSSSAATYAPQLSSFLPCYPDNSLFYKHIRSVCAKSPIKVGVHYCYQLEAMLGEGYKKLRKVQGEGGTVIWLLRGASNVGTSAYLMDRIRKWGREKAKIYQILTDIEKETALGGKGIRSQKEARVEDLGDGMEFLEMLCEVCDKIATCSPGSRRQGLAKEIDEVNWRLRRRREEGISLEEGFAWEEEPQWTQLRHGPRAAGGEGGVGHHGEVIFFVNLFGETKDKVVFNVVKEECTTLSSRERVPWMCTLEVGGWRGWRKGGVGIEEVGDVGVDSIEDLVREGGGGGEGERGAGGKVDKEEDDALRKPAAAAAAATTAASSSSSPTTTAAMTSSSEHSGAREGLRQTEGAGRKDAPAMPPPPPPFAAQIIEGGEDWRARAQVREQIPGSSSLHNGNQNFGYNGQQPHQAQMQAQYQPAYYQDSRDQGLQQQQHNHHQHYHPQQQHQRHQSVQPARLMGKALLDKVFGLPFSELKDRIRSTSPHSSKPGWDVQKYVVKNGEDVRREMVVMQAITLLREAFSSLPPELRPYLRPYTIMCCGEDKGLLECIPDSVSVSDLKKDALGLGVYTLTEFFNLAYPTPHEHYVAQTNFLRSLVGYSLVCYILQIKDRHNANILLSRSGHVVHIDFGYVLGDTPKMGRVPLFNERAPMKLTKEMWDVIGGWGGRAAEVRALLACLLACFAVLTFIYT